MHLVFVPAIVRNEVTNKTFMEYLSVNIFYVFQVVGNVLTKAVKVIMELHIFINSSKYLYFHFNWLLRGYLLVLVIALKAKVHAEFVK
jgi:hypothetical protein